MSNTTTIARNTGWYSLENAVSFLITLFTSIAIARVLGPSKMGHIIYLSWVASVITSLGSIGIPATTRKYMAEFLGRGDRGTARYIYLRTILLQSVLATVATALILLWVLRDGRVEYRTASALIALSIWPAMVNSISAQANVAREEMSANLPGSVISMCIFFLGILGTVVFNWSVVGVGASIVVTRTADCMVRFVPSFRLIHGWKTTHVIPTDLPKRMVTFAWKSVLTMLMALVVWERSEFFLLKNFCADIRQVAFYSVAFSMADRLLLPSAIFGSAAGATIYAQYGRDRSRLPEIAASAVRYLSIIAIPIHVVFAALAIPVLLLLYGHQYAGANTVVSLAPVLCMSKAFINPVQDLLQSFERQSHVIGVTMIAGAIDISIALWLVRSKGAVGACIGSGVAQFTAVAILWFIAIRLFKVKLPWMLMTKVLFISVLTAFVVYSLISNLSPLLGLGLGLALAVVSLFSLFVLMRVIQPGDRDRFELLLGRLPTRLHAPIRGCLFLLTEPRSSLGSKRVNGRIRNA